MTAAVMSDAGPGLREDAQVIGLIGMAHCLSHMNQLLLPPLFPWLKVAFSASYTELGFLLTIFFVTSCVVQTTSGFVVDRFGPRPVLFTGLALLGVAALGYAVSQTYWMLALSSVIAGMGNGVFHPVDYTLLNRKVSPKRLAHGYSVHGITGSLGWAVAPAMLVPLALTWSWRVALLCAALLIFAALATLVFNRDKLALPALPAPAPAAHGKVDGTFDFLRIPAVWLCFGFFFISAIALTIVQAFSSEATRLLHDVPMALSVLCVTVYMVSSAFGMVAGGFLATGSKHCERIVAVGFGIAVVISLMLAFASLAPWMVPALFGLMGFVTGSSGPSRDLLVKQSTPANTSGRVFGVVYSGLDIGQAVSPLIFGAMMDRHDYTGVLVGLAVLQGMLILSALSVHRARRPELATA
jgi:MFS family permease